MPSAWWLFAALCLSPAEDVTQHRPLTPEEIRQIEAAIPEKASVTPRRPRRLLVMTLNVRDGKVIRGHASIPHARYALERMGARTGAYAAVFDNDIEVLRPERLREFDGICFANTFGVLTDDPHLRQSLLDFVASGKGFAGFHAAAATFVQYPVYDQFPAYGEMLGGYENGGHPWKPDETIVIRVEDPAHPVNRVFGGEGFAIADEVFQFMDGPYSRQKLRVLLSIDPARTDMGPHRRLLPERRRDLDFPMSWVKSYGKGRVFYSSFGHNPHIWWNPKLLAHFLDGIQFVLGDLEADTTPSGAPPRKP